MHPLTKAAAAAATVAALGQPAAPVERPLDGGLGPPPPTPSAARDDQLRHCPRGSFSLPSAPVDSADSGHLATIECVPLPAAQGASQGARARRLSHAPPSETFIRTHPPDEMVPRLPERPAAFANYQLPVDPVLAASVAGQGPSPSMGGGAGLNLETDPETVVTLVDLEGQTEPPVVVLVGELYGVTVAVHHRTHQQSRERDYLVLYGHLDRPGPEVVNGAELSPMSIIGYTARGGASSQLYLEVREQLAAGSAQPEHLSELVRADQSVAVDPRNVLPLRR